MSFTDSISMYLVFMVMVSWIYTFIPEPPSGLSGPRTTSDSTESSPNTMSTKKLHAMHHKATELSTMSRYDAFPIHALSTDASISEQAAYHESNAPKTILPYAVNCHQIARSSPCTKKPRLLHIGDIIST